MLACGGVDALVLEDETGYGDVIQDVRLDDFSNIFGLHLAVPHCFGIDDHRGPMLTLIEAAGFVGAYRALQTTIGKCGLEELLQVASGTLRATSALPGSRWFVQMKMCFRNFAMCVSYQWNGFVP